MYFDVNTSKTDLETIIVTELTTPEYFEVLGGEHNESKFMNGEYTQAELFAMLQGFVEAGNEAHA